MIRSIRLGFAQCALLSSLVVTAAGLPAFSSIEPPAKNTRVSATDELWRKSPPVTPPPRPFRLPHICSYKLNNDLEVELVEDHRVPFITVELGIKAGSSVDPPGLSGLSSMTADMATEGTRSRTSKQIADEIDYIGGGLKGASDQDFTLVVGSCLSQYTDRLFSLLSDVVLNPTFPARELKLKKTNLLQELVMKRSEPEFLAEERFHKVVFGSHPYSRVAPTPESVQRITIKDLQDFHASHYLPNQATLVVVGDFDQKALELLIAKEFDSARWKAGTMPVSKHATTPAYHGRKIYLVDRPGSVQSCLRIGNVAIKKTDPDYFPMLVANQILGGAADSRLFLNIREQKGYTYGAYSSFAARKEPGEFDAEADVRTEVTAPSLEEFLYELDKIRNLKPSNTELKDAKTYLTGHFQLGLETQAGLAQRLLELKLYELPANYLETYTSRIMNVNADEVRRVARRHIDFNNLVIAVVGDAKKIKTELEYFAPVELYGVDGKPVKTTAAAAHSGT